MWGFYARKQLFWKMCFLKSDIVIIISLLVTHSPIIQFSGEIQNKSKDKEKQQGAKWQILKRRKVKSTCIFKEVWYIIIL